MNAGTRVGLAGTMTGIEGHLSFHDMAGDRPDNAGLPPLTAILQAAGALPAAPSELASRGAVKERAPRAG
jgi:hypothetical protein